MALHSEVLKKSQTDTVEFLSHTCLADLPIRQTPSDNLGMYLLTAEPNVWYFRFSDESLTRQSIAFGQWENASDIASFGGNIYLLAPDGINKHVKTLSGFSQKIIYATSAQSVTISGAKAMAIDGSACLAMSSNDRFVAIATIRQLGLT